MTSAAPLLELPRMLTLQAKSTCRAVVRCYLYLYRAMIISVWDPGV